MVGRPDAGQPRLRQGLPSAVTESSTPPLRTDRIGVRHEKRASTCPLLQLPEPAVAMRRSRPLGDGHAAYHGVGGEGGLFAGCLYTRYASGYPA